MTGNLSRSFIIRWLRSVEKGVVLCKLICKANGVALRFKDDPRTEQEYLRTS